jgi:hypothetical protein
MMMAAASSVVRKKTFIGARADLAHVHEVSSTRTDQHRESHIVNVIAPIPLPPNEIDATRPLQES